MKKDTQSIYDLPQGDLQEEQPRRLRQKKKPRKWLWLTLIVLVVLGAVAAAVLWDANSFDGLRRSIIYARAEKDETGCAKLYYYENDATSRFAAIDGSLVTVAANQVRLLDERSQVLYQNSVRFPIWCPMAVWLWPMTLAARRCTRWTARACAGSRRRRASCSPSPSTPTAM